MTTPLILQLSLLFNETVTDKAGDWQYAAADAVDMMSGQTAQLIATKRTNSFGGNSFPVSMLTATVMLPAVGTNVPENLTIQGVHDLTTNDETGSVSSASSGLADYIGGSFRFDAKAGILIISPCC